MSDALHVIGWFEVEPGSGELHQCMAGATTERRIGTMCGIYGPRDDMVWRNDRGTRCRRCVDKDEDMRLTWQIQREADERQRNSKAEGTL